MKILFVTPPPYLPNRLHRNRSFDLIKVLSEKHKVHLIAVATETKEYPDFNEIKRVCESVTILRVNKYRAYLNCVLHPFLPLEVAYCFSDEAKTRISDLIINKNIDLIYAKRLRSAIFLPETDLPVLIDSTDAMSLFYKKMGQDHKNIKKIFYNFESKKYFEYERKLSKKKMEWIISSQKDANYLKDKLNIRSNVVPNAVDIQYFKFKSKISSRKIILFSGLMDKPVNVTAATYFVNQIFPKVFKSKSDVQLKIVGPKPSKCIKELGSHNINVMGFVKDIRKQIRESSVVVAPLTIGTGVRNKILQAWAMGTPVVSTSIGASGLAYKNGKNIGIADSLELFAKKVIKILDSPAHARKLSINGRKTVESKYSFEQISIKIEKVINEVTGKTKKNSVKKY